MSIWRKAASAADNDPGDNIITLAHVYGENLHANVRSAHARLENAIAELRAALADVSQHRTKLAEHLNSQDLGIDVYADDVKRDDVMKALFGDSEE